MRRRSWIALALLLGTSAAQSAEPQLGRLFHTPSERAALDEARRKNIRAEAVAAEPAKPRPPRARIVTVTGLVQRSDGEAYAWVNGKPVEMDGAQRQRMRVAPGQPGVLMSNPEQGRAVEIKVGQRADLRTGRVQETYELKRGTAQAETTPSVPRGAAAAQARTRTQRTSEAQPPRPARDPEDAEENEDVEG
jgi:hypothetical protein